MIKYGNFKTISTLGVAITIALSMSGCANKDNSQMLLEQKNKTIAKLQEKLQVTKNEVNEKDIKIKQLKSQNIALAKNTKEAEKKDKNSVANNSLIPPNAKVGECFAKVLVPPVYKEETKTRLVRAGTKSIVVIPATYKVVDKKVQIRAKSKKLVVIPAVYKKVKEKILVQPEKTKLIVIPATYKTVTNKVLVSEARDVIKTVPTKYKTVTEKILISPAHTEWKRGRGEIEKINNATGDIMCLVEVPAVYKTVTKKVVDVPAHTVKKVIPAVYETVTKRVVDVPAHTVKKVIPAVYKTITKKVLVTPATTKEITIPAICKIVKTRVIDKPAKEVVVKKDPVYKDYTIKVKVADSYLRWQPILCKTNTKPNIIKKLQRRLKQKGYAIRKITGVYDRATKAAVNKYQKDNSLSTGALTLKTLESLGLN